LKHSDLPPILVLVVLHIAANAAELHLIGSRFKAIVATGGIILAVEVANIGKNKFQQPLNQRLPIESVIT